MCMARTNIDIDDALIARVMEKYDLRTKREAVDFALREVAGPETVTAEWFEQFRGIGWDGDLEALRDNPAPEP